MNSLPPTYPFPNVGSSVGEMRRRLQHGHRSIGSAFAQGHSQERRGSSQSPDRRQRHAQPDGQIGGSHRPLSRSQEQQSQNGLRLVIFQCQPQQSLQDP